jgi:hypothetical protein
MNKYPQINSYVLGLPFFDTFKVVLDFDNFFIKIGQKEVEGDLESRIIGFDPDSP